MKLRVLGIGILALTLLGTPAMAQEPGGRIREALRKATPEQRQAAFTELRQKYPDLPQELRRHLREKYPNLPGAALRAGLEVGRQNPGLPFGLAAHLVKDLGGEPLEAFLDVGAAVNAEYPGLRERVRELRREARERHPGLRTDVIASLRASSPGLFSGLRQTVARVLHEKHPGLGLAVAEEVSRYRDEHPGSLREQPGAVLGLLGRLKERQGDAMRAAAVDVLTAVGTEHGSALNSAAGAVLTMVQEKHPGVLADLGSVRRKLQQEFPGLRPLVMKTLQEKHPGLLGRAWGSVNQHYPDLREQFQAALEKQAPGVGEEAQRFLASRYPDLEEDVLKALR